MVERAVLRRRSAERKAAAVEQLGNEVGHDDVLHVHPRAVSDALHLLEEAARGRISLLGGDALDDPLRLEQVDPAGLDLDLLALDLEQVIGCSRGCRRGAGPPAGSPSRRASPSVQDADNHGKGSLRGNPAPQRSRVLVSAWQGLSAPG